MVNYKQNTQVIMDLKFIKTLAYIIFEVLYQGILTEGEGFVQLISLC